MTSIKHPDAFVTAWSLKIQSYSKSGSCFAAIRQQIFLLPHCGIWDIPGADLDLLKEFFNLCCVNIRPRCHGSTGAITTFRLFSNYVHHFLTRSSLNTVSSPYTSIEWRLIFVRRYVLPIKTKSHSELCHGIKFLMLSLHINLSPE